MINRNVIVYLFIALSLCFTTSYADNRQIDYQIRYPYQVNQLLQQINSQNLWSNLTVLTTLYPSRSSTSPNGIAAVNWVKQQITTMAKAANRNDVTIYTVKTKCKDSITGIELNLPQPSLVVKIGSASTPGIVLGAHIDSVDCSEVDPTGNCPTYGTKAIFPGADDDGTGAVTLLEVARLLLNSNMRFQKPIYLMWYGAEERGAIGSQCVVGNFQRLHIPVSAAFQMDMTGYRKNNDPTMWIENGRAVNKKLSNYLFTLVKTYIKFPVQFTCDGDSDEWSWTDAGIPAARAIEDNDCITYNPYSHSPEDTMDKLSLDHMTNYLKLAIAFGVEMAQPIN